MQRLYVRRPVVIVEDVVQAGVEHCVETGSSLGDAGQRQGIADREVNGQARAGRLLTSSRDCVSPAHPADPQPTDATEPYLVVGAVCAVAAHGATAGLRLPQGFDIDSRTGCTARSRRS